MGDAIAAAATSAALSPDLAGDKWTDCISTMVITPPNIAPTSTSLRVMYYDYIN